jgi:hypothetical protein
MWRCAARVAFAFGNAGALCIGAGDAVPCAWQHTCTGFICIEDGPSVLPVVLLMECPVHGIGDAALSHSAAVLQTFLNGEADTGREGL